MSIRQKQLNFLVMPILNEFCKLEDFLGEEVFGKFTNRKPKSVEYYKEIEIKEDGTWYTYKMWNPTRKRMAIAYITRKKSITQ
tara:strand:+ start:39566 stop:39814 length:249 start_codon:yes stop_codon:yes gene_type:complete